VCWEGVSRDVTAVRAAQRAASLAEQRYQSLVEQLPAVVFVDHMQPEPRTVYISAEIERLLGIPPSVFIGDRDAWERSIHPEDREWVMEAFNAAVGRRQRYDLEYRVVRPDGRVVWVLRPIQGVRDAPCQ
jgi:PAS domain S-box-containing protein